MDGVHGSIDGAQQRVEPADVLQCPRPSVHQGTPTARMTAILMRIRRPPGSSR
jgi:hypothetical protein